MIKTEDTYKRALEQKRAALAKKNAERELYLNAIYAANPRLLEIDAELAVFDSVLERMQAYAAELIEKQD